MAAQLPDFILVNGDKMELYSNPLEQFWIRMNKRRPAFYALATCKRGYIATWEIRDKNLHLKSIDGNYEKNTLFFGKQAVRYSLKSLFPRAGTRLVKADWYSGKLRIPLGHMTYYQHKGYDSRFEKEMIITVERGHVVKEVTLDYTHQTLVVS